MKYIFAPIVISALYMSCGLERDQTGRDPASGVGGALLETSRDLNETEERIATRICFAFRNKRLSFSNIHLNDSYTYCEEPVSCSGVKTVCERDQDNPQVVVGKITPTVALDALGLYFSNNNQVDFRIETDTYGYLKDTCSKLTKGEQAQNMYSQNGVDIFLSFRSSNGKDYFGVQVAFNQPQSPVNLIRNAHEFEVQTSGSNSKTLGLVTKHTQTNICSDNSSSSSIIRTYRPDL